MINASDILLNIRTWIKVYVVLRGQQISFFNTESAFLKEDGFIESQPVLDLNGCSAEVAVDYTKRENVFRLR